MDDVKIKSFLGIQMSGETWYNFRWDFTAAVLFSFFNVAFNQFYVPIAIRHGASDLEVGLLTAAPAVGLLFSPIWASLMEGRKAKPFTVWPNLIGRSLLLVPAFFTSPSVFVAFAFFYQILMGIQAPAYTALITRVYPAPIRGRLMGNVRVFMGLLMIPLAFTIGGWIDRSDSRGALIVAAVTGVISIFAFNRLREGGESAVRPAKRSRLREQFAVLQGNPRLVVFLTATTLSGFGNMLAGPLYQLIQVHTLDLSNLQIGVVRMMYYACLLTAYLVMGWVIDRYSPLVALRFGICSYMLVPLIYGLIGTYPAVIAASGFQGFGDAIWDIGTMSYVMRIARGKEALVFGLHLMLFGIRGTIGPLLATSLVHTVPFPSILLAASFCSLLGFLLLMAQKAKGFSSDSELSA